MIVEGKGFVRVEKEDNSVNGFGNGLIKCME